MTVKEVLLRAEDHMKKSLDLMGREFSQMRSGRASTTLIEHIKVEAYDNVVPLNQVGELVSHDVLKTLRRLLGELQIQPNAAGLRVAGPPLGFHLLDAPIGQLNAQDVLPFRK